MKLGCDISKWQAGLDLKKLKDQGVRFVMIRAGYGSGYIDQWADYFYDKVKELGLEVGAYWFSYADTIGRARDEARYLLEWAEDKEMDYPLVFDYELQSKRGSNIGNTLINLMAEAFCGKVEEEGYYAMVYTNKSWLNNVWNDDTKKAYGMWIAHYGKEKNLPKLAQMWQYTNSPLDMDYDVIGLSNIIRKKGLNHLG